MNNFFSQNKSTATVQDFNYKYKFTNLFWQKNLEIIFFTTDERTEILVSNFGLDTGPKLHNVHMNVHMNNILINDLVWVPGGGGNQGIP